MVSISVAISVVICSLLSYFMARTMYKDNRSVRKAYVSGMPLGIATVLWGWSCITLPVLIWYLYSPMKINNTKIFYAATLGMLTPLWVMLPIWMII